jgi:hypothetical protein
MNIDDIDTSKLEAPRVNQWGDLLDKQSQLHEKYKDIEVGIGYGIIAGQGPFHIDKRRCQYYVKDLMWRFHEEVAEAYQAYDQIESEGSHRHYQEELIDALHFLLELNVVVGYVTPPTPYYVNASLGMASFELGLAANQLKNKPWKQDFKETDFNAFLGYLSKANSSYWSFLHKVFGGSEQIWEMYMAKHKVNEFRIESNY